LASFLIFPAANPSYTSKENLSPATVFLGTNECYGNKAIDEQASTAVS